MLRPFWTALFSFNATFGLFLIMLFGVPRFILVLQANITGNYGMVPIIFVMMWVAPIIFLTQQGRKYIGFTKPENYSWLFFSFCLGILICILFYLISEIIFGDAISNSFVYISKSYKLDAHLTASDRFIYFVIYSITAMTFSPIGEELFYRGIIHGSFAQHLGERKASLIDSAAFAITHLAHFGIIYHLGQWNFLLLPSLLWIAAMFGVSQLFFYCRTKSGSLLGAILCHAGYNLAMMYVIFYHVLK